MYCYVALRKFTIRIQETETNRSRLTPGVISVFWGPSWHERRMIFGGVFSELGDRCKARGKRYEFETRTKKARQGSDARRGVTAAEYRVVAGRPLLVINCDSGIDISDTKIRDSNLTRPARWERKRC